MNNFWINTVSLYCSTTCLHMYINKKYSLHILRYVLSTNNSNMDCRKHGVDLLPSYPLFPDGISRAASESTLRFCRCPSVGSQEHVLCLSCSAHPEVKHQANSGKKKKKKINTNFHFFLYRAVSPGSSGKESNSHYSVREQKHIFSDSPSTPLCIE